MSDENDTPEGENENEEEMSTESDDSESKQVKSALALLPVHDLPGIGIRSHVGSRTANAARSKVVQFGDTGIGLVVRKAGGSPKKINKAPTFSDLEYHAKVAIEKLAHIDRDPLVRAVRERASVAETLQVVKEQIAIETSSIQFQRMENEKRGLDTAQTSGRRIDALSKIASIELEIKKLGTGETIDLRSERFLKVFAIWVEMLREVAQETLPPQVLDLFFNKLHQTMEGWEERVAQEVG